MSRRNSPEQYHQLAAERGFEWLGTEVISSRTPTLWRCQSGHEWWACFSGIKRGRGCPICSHRTTKTESDYHTLAASRGFTWTGATLPSDTHTKTTWLCRNGHKICKSYNRLLGFGCLECTPHRRLIADNFNSVAYVYGFEWISPQLPIRNNIKHVWRCKQGHEWTSTYNHVSNGIGCPYCAGLAPKTADDYRALAAKRGLTWLGENAVGVEQITIWLCPHGHLWETTYTRVRRGAACAHCTNRVNGSYVSKPQLAIHDMLGGDVNYQVGRYRLDIALFTRDVKIAIEYDCWYWHEKTQAHDAKRQQFLLDRGWRLLRVKSANEVPTRDQLNHSIQCLVAGSSYAEIILGDWQGT